MCRKHMFPDQTAPVLFVLFVLFVLSAKYAGGRLHARQRAADQITPFAKKLRFKGGRNAALKPFKKVLVKR